MKSLVSVAGLDPTSGAGITKDLEIFAGLGFHGIGIPTSIVVQGPGGVKSISRIPLGTFEEMLKVFESEEIELSGVKTGVLVGEEYVKTISGMLSNLKKAGKPVVVDPVLKAKNGYELLSREGIEALKGFVLPKCTILTANVEEAQILADSKIEDLDNMRECAKRLKDLGPEVVIIKGGHLSGDPVDVYYDGHSFIEKEKVRLEKEVHGTGCVFSSSLLGFLARGLNPREAFFEAENLTFSLIKDSYRINADGYYYPSLYERLRTNAERFEAISSLREIRERLERLNPVELIPEVQMNICYAIPDARTVEDVCAYPGRISKHKGRILIKSDPEFGASSHVARTLLAFMKFFPEMRSCANLKFDKSLLEKAKKNGLKVVLADRKSEPESIKEKEGRSLEFLVEKSLSSANFVPDIIYDEGDIGKEPMIRLFARNPFELLEKMEKLLR
ncbi:MAG: PfkB family carbohydrate kinase [Deltaproteobacteria bacterium]|nr:PfkB family carbohydrate kinase [Deltaproteobacteria bacterium]